MSKAKKITGIAALALAMTAGFAAIASPPPRPASFFGTISTDGFEIPAGTRVAASAGNRLLAETVVFPADGHIAYSLDIPGDIPETPALEGAVAGQAITLKVGGAAAPQPAAWEAGTYKRLDLSVPAGPDITVAINDGVASVFPGGDLTYTLTVRNNGPQAATGIVLQDLLPAHATATSLGGGTVADGIVSWPPFDLEAGASTTRTMTLEVATELPVGTTSITNQARASHDGARGLDPKPLDNLGSDTNAVLVPPDFALFAADLTVSPAQPRAGDLVTVQLTVRNPGHRDGTALVAVYAGVPFATPPVASQTVTLQAQGAVTRTFHFTAGGPLTLVSAAADPANQVVELDESNNVARRFLAEVPDLAIGLDNVLAAPAAPRAGDAVQVKVTVRNAGRKLAENVDVTLYDGEPGLGGVAVGTGRIASLPAGGNRALSFDWTAAEGQRKLTAVADPDNAFLEMSEENNSAVREIVVPRAAGPDLTVRSLDVTGLAQSAITLVADGAVSAVLANVGDAMTASDFAVRLFEDRDGDRLFSRGDRELARQTVSAGLGAGAAATVQLPLRAHLEFHHPLLWVEADAADAIVELREDNNRTACFGVCEPTAAASLTPVDEEWFLPGMEVETAPVVIQLSDDNDDGRIDSRDIPEVVFHTEDGAGFAVTARSGVDGSETWTFRSSEQYRLGSRLVHVTAADLDGDGVAEILAGLQDQRLLALDHFGQPMWTSDPVPLITRSWAGAPSVADLTGDGVPEIVIGHTVLSNTGKLLGAGTANAGQSYNWYGPLGVPTAPGVDAQLSVVADIDLDGRPEIVAGDAVYRLEGGQVKTVWNNTVADNLMRDGFSVVANLDGDPQAEIVYTSSGFAMVLNHDGTVAVAAKRIYPFSNNPEANTFWGGPPTVANLDGQGAPEILFAGDTELRAFRADLSLYWSKPIAERAAHTAATVFDLDGDASPEVLYLDQTHFYILNGRNGSVLYQRPNSSKTGAEYPVVADVDNDGQAEILVPSNLSFGGDATTQGLHALGNPGWSGTRPIWNQHAYHVTNVLLDGTVPAAETPSWQTDNSYRVNQKLDRKPPLWPNATVGAPRVGPVTSSGASVKVRVGNGGLGVLPAGLPVVLTRAGDGAVAGQGATTRSLRPGDWEDVELFWQLAGPAGAAATAAVDPRNALRECDESDNSVHFQVTESVLPDLTIPAEGVTLPATVSGQIAQVSVRVENHGSARSVGGVLRLYVGPPSLGVQGGQAALPEIAPGQGATVQVAWDTLGLAGTQVLHAMADAEGDVLEGDDTNNTATREVTLAAPTRPDPAVESLSIVPSPAAIGAPVLLSAEVVNRGTALPNGFVLSFRLNSGEVARITSAEALAPNARRTVQHTLQTLSLQGRQLVEAVADPANAIVEQNEGNNRQTGWLDLAGAGLAATLRTDRVSYRSNETATLTVTVQNSGEPRTATLRVYVNDSFGNPLASVVEQPLALPAGNSTFTHGWSTGATPPGTYSAVADLALDGTVVSRAVSPFSILGDRSASAVLYSDRGEYEPGQSVVLSGRLRNTGVNQTLVNLQARLTVQAPGGATVFTSSRAIQVFEPGAEEMVGGAWSVANAAPGVYTARLELRESSTALLAFASLPVTVLDSGQTGAGLSGSLTVSPDPVGSGAPLLARFTTQNGGNADMSALRLRVRLLRVSDGEAVASREIPWPLARNQQRGGSLTFPTGGLPEGEYRAVLEGLLPGREAGLGSAPFNAGRGVSVADVTLAEGNAGTSQGVFEVSLSSASEGEVRVGYRTVDGTAVAAEDYEEATGTLVFPPGERRQTVTVNVLGDTLAEAEEVFLLELTDPIGVLLGDAQALGVLTDEEGCASPDLLTNGGGEDGTADSDLPAWTTAAGNWQRRLGDPVPLVGNASLVAGGTVDRAELWQEADLAPFAGHIDGPGLALAFESFVQSLPADTPDMARILIEFRDAAGTVLETWDSGETGSPSAWQAVVATRTAPAGTRRVRVRLTAVRHGQEPIGVAFDRVALRSLGVPVLAAEGVELTEGNSGSRDARFALRLSCPAPAGLDVSFATADGSARAGSDYDQASGTATFAAGNREAAVTVTVRGDLADEQDETFMVELASGAGVVLLESRLTGLIQDDDGQVTIAVDDAFVDEAPGARAEITVRLSSPSGKAVTVDYETVAGSATQAADFVTASGTLTFEPGVESLTVGVDIPDDGVDEGDETFELRLSAPVNAALADGTAAVTIRDGDRAELLISDATVIEGHGTVVDATFLVTLTVPSSREVQVAYATENGTAVAGTDYQATAGTLTIQPGSTSATVAVRILGNRTPQSDRLFRVRLDAPVGAALLDPEGEGTIRDDDGVTITIDDRTITEGDSGSADVTFTIRVANHDKQVTVSYATVDGTARAGTDYTAVSGTLTFERGKGPLTVTVPVAGDLAEEQVLETFQLRLSNQSAGSLLRPAGTTTIVDNDGWAFNGVAAATSQGCIDVVPPPGGYGTAWFKQQIDLSRSFDQTWKVNLGDHEDDATGMTFTLHRSTRGLTTTGYTDPQAMFYGGISPSMAVELDTVQNWDDSLEDHLAVDLNGELDHDGHAPVPMGQMEDGKSHDLRIVWNAGARQLDVHYDGVERIKMVRDLVAEVFGGDPLVWYGFTAAAGPTSSYSACPTVKCWDESQPKQVSVGDVHVLEGEAGTVSASFPVTLSCPSTQPVTVSYRTLDGTAKAGSDYTAASGSVTFAPGETSKSVTVQVLKDAVTEQDETFRLVLSSPVNGAIRYGEGVATLNAEDIMHVVPPRFAESWRVEAWDLRLTQPSPWPLSFRLEVADGTAKAGEDYAPAAGNFSFRPGETTAQPHVLLRMRDSGGVEPDETFHFQLTNRTNRLVPQSLPVVTADVVGRCIGSDNLVKNPNADEAVTNGQMPGWIQEKGVWRISDSHFWSPDSPHAEMYQDVDVSSFASLIASGQQRFLFDAWVFSHPFEWPRDTTRFILEFLDATKKTTLATWDSTDLHAWGNDWRRVSNVLTPPAGTAFIRIRLITDMRMGPYNDAYADTVSLLSMGVPNLRWENPAPLAQEGSTGGQTISVPVLLECPSATTVTVDYVTADGTARAGSDYLPALGTLTFAPGETRKYATVQVLGDTLGEGDETFSLTLTGSENAGIERGLATVTIQEDEVALDVEGVAVPEGSSGRRDMVFPVRLSAASTQVVTVDWFTSDSTARAGSDYLEARGTLTFQPGETLKHAVVKILGDQEPEPDEKLKLTLDRAVNAVLRIASVDGVIQQDDLGLSIGDAAVVEGDGNTALAGFTVRLSAASQAVVTVDWATRDDRATAGADYKAVSGRVTIPAGATSATLTVPILGDDLAEASETFFVDLSNPVNAALSDGLGIGSIADDDGCAGPNLVRNPGGDEAVSGNEIPGWTRAAGSVWARAMAPPAPVTADGMFQTTAAQAELWQDVDVSMYASFIDTGRQRFLFEGYLQSGQEVPADAGRFIVDSLSQAKAVLGSFDSGEIASPGGWRQVVDLREVPAGTRWIRIRLLARRVSGTATDAFFDAVTLRSVDTPVFLVPDLTVFEGDTASVPAHFDIELTCASEQAVQVDYKTVDGSAVSPADFQAAAGTLTFAPGETRVRLTVPVAPDYANEVRETFQLQLSAPRNAVLVDKESVATIRDAEPGKPPVSGDDRTYTTDAELDLAAQVALSHETPAAGQLRVSSQGGTFPYIWIAASARGTIVKIDTKTGQILGEYATAPNVNGVRRESDPSRTTVSLDGSAWVGNRKDASVAHIGLPELGQCVDRNGNGGIDTSIGYGDVLSWSDAGGVDSDGGVETAQDECILHYVKVAAERVRHLSVDAENNLWVSGFLGANEGVFNMLDTDTGAVVRTSQKFPCGGYGGLIDGDGFLWSASNGGNILRLDTRVWPPTSTSWRCIGGTKSYGLGIDASGWLWVSELEGNRLWKMSPNGSTLLGAYGHGSHRAQGIAVDGGGDVWVTSSRLSNEDLIGRVRNDGLLLGVVRGVPLGSTGVAVDDNNKIWVASESASSAARIDPTKGPLGADGRPLGVVDLIVPLPGANPYNYSDMTGYQAFRSTAQQGRWELIQDAGYDNARWGLVEWNREAEGQIPAGARIEVEARVSATITGLGRAIYMPVTNGVPFEQTGRFLQVRVTLHRNQQKQSPVLSDIRVRVLKDGALAVNDARIEEGHAGTASAAFTVSLAEPVNQEVRVAYATADGTAVAGQDYSAVNGTLVFPAGVTQQTVNVPVLGDLRLEADETFFLSLSAPVHASLADAQGQAVIANDDQAPALTVTKTAALQVDQRDDGDVNPGDVLRYEVKVENGLEGLASGLLVSDAVPVHTTLVAGSVVPSAGTVESSSPVRVRLAELPAGGTLTVRFDVRVDDPLPEDVESITNRADARAAELAGPVFSNETVTPVVAGPPILAASKTDKLVEDADLDRVPSPGDRLLYTIELTNSGPAAATNVVFEDVEPRYTTIVASSVTTDAGTVTSTDPVRVEVGTLMPDARVAIRFEVVIDNPVPARVASLSNQGTVTSAELPALLTDDPDLGGTSDATVTAITAAPRLVAEKTAMRVADPDRDGRTSPGDTLEYLITVRNRGNTDATGVTFADPIPLHTTLVDGSVIVSQGAGGVEQGRVRADLGEIAGSKDATIRFRVVIDSPFPAEAREVSNQGEVDAVELDPVPTDDPGVGGPSDPTVTVVAAAPKLEVDKKATLTSGLVAPGDAFLYVITIANRGNTAATGVVLADDLPAGLALVPGTLQTSQGSVTTEEPLRLALGQIAASATATVSFQVSVEAGFTGTEVANQATVTAERIDSVPSNDPDTEAPGDPTSTPVFITPDISIENVMVAEGAGTAEVQVRLSEAGNREVLVDFATAGGTATAGSDYTSATGSLTFAPGETARTISLLVLDDLLDEADEILTIALANAAGGNLAASSATVTIEDDDAAPTFAIADVIGAEGGTVELTVSLSAPSGLPVQIGYATTDGTATGADYTAASGRLTIPAGSTTATFVVQTSADELFETNEKLFVNLIDPVNATPFDAQGEVTITDDDPMPTLSIANVTVTEGDSGAVTATLTVSLSAVSGLDASAKYATEDGTATAGADYTAAMETLTIPAGSTTATLTIQVLGDLLDELDETFGIVLSAPVSATLADAEGTVSVADNDEAPTFAIADVQVTEGGAVELTVTLSAPSGRQIELDYTTADGTALAGTDYAATSGTLTMPAGSTAVSFPVQTVADALFETDEKLFVNLISPVNATPADAQAQVTITDHNQPPALSISDVTVTEKTGETVTAELTVSLSAPSGRTTTVSYATADGTALAGSDYTADSRTITIPAGATTATIAIEVLGDDVDELDETFRVVLSNPVAATLADAEGTVEVHDNDEARLTVADVEVTEGGEGVTEAVFTVRLSTPSDRQVRVDCTTEAVTASEGTDYQKASGTLAFDAGEASKTVSVRVSGDRLFEENETFELVLANASGAPIQDGRATGKIIDDEECPTPNLLANPGAEDGSTQAGVIPGWTADGAAWRRRTGNPAAAEGAAYFAAGAGGRSELFQDVDVSAYADRIDTGLQRFLFEGVVRTLNEVPSDTVTLVVEYRDAAGTLDVFDSGQIASTQGWTSVLEESLVPAGTRSIRVRLIADLFGGTTNDAWVDGLSLTALRAPSIYISDERVYESSTGTTSAVFDVSLSCALDRASSVAFSTVNGTAVAGEDYQPVGGTLTFPAGSTRQAITVPVVGDQVHERHETFVIDLENPEPRGLVSLLDRKGEGTIVNDDFCARSPGFWKEHNEVWPVRSLVMGGRLYSEAQMMALLSYNGSDASNHLARQLVATRLNLEVGSSTAILTDVQAADTFLASFPPGSNPKGANRDRANAIKNKLDAYNNSGCQQVPVIP